MKYLRINLTRELQTYTLETETLLREIKGDVNKRMEQITKFMGQKTQYCQYINFPQIYRF